MSATTSSSQPTCTWLGHCLGDQCQTQDDCDNDWVCTSSRCAIASKSSQRSLTKAQIAGISAGVPVLFALIVGLIILYILNRRRKRQEQSPPQEPDLKKELPPAYAQYAFGPRPSYVATKLQAIPELGSNQAPVELGGHELSFQEMEGEPKHLPYVPPPTKDHYEGTQHWVPQTLPPPPRTMPIWEEVDIGLRNWHACSEKGDGSAQTSPMPTNFSRPISRPSPSNSTPPVRPATAPQQKYAPTASSAMPERAANDEEDDELVFREGDPYAFFSWPAVKPRSHHQPGG